jgi:hypothetical protein
MIGDEWSIISNVFASNMKFSDISRQLDAFRLEGVGSGASKYRIVGKIINKLGWDNKSFFVHYSVYGKSYAVGFLNHKPAQDELIVGSAKAIYEGHMDLDHKVSGHKTLAALLNKAKEVDTKSELWKGGIHTYFPVNGIDLTDDYKASLILFRGPNYRYNILNDGRIVLSLDVATRYVDSRPYIEHIRTSGLDPLRDEIDLTRREMKKLGKKFRGIHFFYTLTPMDVGIDGIDPRPIKEISANESQSVFEYLIKRYRGQKLGDWLDPDQPGLRKGEFSFAPQFLHKNVRFQDVPSRIKAEHTFFTDSAQPPDRDPEHTARIRWEKTIDLFEEYRFSTLTLGPHQIEFQPPLEFPSSNYFSPPKLVAASGNAVHPSGIKDEIKKGLYQEVPINKTYLYSSGSRKLALSFYDSMTEYAQENFNFKLPDRSILLEPDIRKMELQIQKSLDIDSHNAVVIAIIDKANRDIHDRITNICGRLTIPAKCITESTVKTVVKQKRVFPLAGYVSSLLTRANCIPWVLASHLSYDCYIATDVGRAKSENWVMLIVYDKMGKYQVGQTELTVGESIDRDSLAKCIEEVKSLVPNVKSLLYLRDGSIYDREKSDFEFVMKNSGIKHSAILAIRKDTPFRVYRGSQSDLWRSHSGDYYILDKANMVLCAAGADEYEHGTPSPITVEFIPVVGLIDELKAIEDVFKLSYLNWASPGRSYSTPAPLRMAHRIAREISLGIDRSTAPF